MMAIIFVPYPMRYLPSHLMTWDREFSNPTITHHGKFTQHAARSGILIYIPDAAIRLAQRSSLLVVFPALVGNFIGCGMALWQTDILIQIQRR